MTRLIGYFQKFNAPESRRIKRQLFHAFFENKPFH